jgi:hypothetical protein
MLEGSVCIDCGTPLDDLGCCTYCDDNPIMGIEPKYSCASGFINNDDEEIFEEDEEWVDPDEFQFDIGRYESEEYE